MERSGNEKIKEAIVIKSAEEFLRLRFSDSEEDQIRANSDSASEEVWLNVIEKYPEMKEYVARNQSVTANILNILANDGNRRVRWSVASNLKTSTETLRLLSKDFDEAVRQDVAINPNTPIELLKTLENDPWEGVVEVVKERLEKLGA